MHERKSQELTGGPASGEEREWLIVCLGLLLALIILGYWCLLEESTLLPRATLAEHPGDVYHLLADLLCRPMAV